MTSNNNSNVVGQIFFGLLAALGSASLLFVLFVWLVNANNARQAWVPCSIEALQGKNSNQVVVSGNTFSYRGITTILPENSRQEKCSQMKDSVVFGVDNPSDRLEFSLDNVTVKPKSGTVIVIWNDETNKPMVFTSHTTMRKFYFSSYAEVELPTKAFWQFW